MIKMFVIVFFRFVSLLDYAEESLNVKSVVLCLSKTMQHLGKVKFNNLFYHLN